MKLNVLPPTLRDKKRYIVFKIICEEEIDFDSFRKNLSIICLKLFGEVTVSKMKLWVIKNLYGDNRGVIKVNRDFVEHLRLCLSLIKEIDGKEVIIAIEGVTGTVDSAERKYLGREK